MMVNSHIIHLCTSFVLGLTLRVVYHTFDSRRRCITSSCYLSLKRVERIVAKRHLKNVETILSGDKTGLPETSIDVVLLYDVLHELDKPDEILIELHRILRPRGVLSVSDHHLKESEIVTAITQKGWFQLLRKGQKTYSFLKI